jgi:hypothetical protein
VRSALDHVAIAASLGNYKPAAEFFAGRTGKHFAISNRASFEALPDLFEAQIMTAKSGKNRGYISRKGGSMSPGAVLSIALELKNLAEKMIAKAKEFTEARCAARVEAAWLRDPGAVFRGDLVE